MRVFRFMLLCGLMLLALPLQAEETEFKIDPVHSFVTFKVSNRGVGHVTGIFTGVDGSVTADPEAGTIEAVEVTVRAESVFTGVEKRDNHLRSKDFLHVEKNPVITFKSTEVERRDGDVFSVSGDLTLNGVTRKISVAATYKGYNPRLKVVGGECDLVIKRSDYGINFMVPNIGDEVLLHIILEAGVKK